MNNNKIPASLRSDRVAGLVRNRWPLCFGTGGRNGSEWVADFIGIGSKHKEFETATIDTLKDMASGDGLKKAPQIIQVIKSSEKEVS